MRKPGNGDFSKAIALVSVDDMALAKLDLVKIYGGTTPEYEVVVCC